MTIRTVDEELVGRLRSSMFDEAGELGRAAHEAATLIEQLHNRVERLEGLLGEARIYVDDCFGDLDRKLSSEIDAALTGEHNG